MPTRVSRKSQARSGSPPAPAPIQPEVAKAALAAAADLVLVLSADGVIQQVVLNDALQPETAWQQLSGKPWHAVVADDSRRKVELMLQELKESGKARPREINLRQADGTTAPFRFALVRLSSTEPTLAAVGRDLRPLSVLQQQLLQSQQAMDREFVRMRQAETRYRLLFQVSSEGVLVIELSSQRIIESNQAAGQLLQRSMEELQRSPLASLLDRPSLTSLQAMFTALQAGERQPELELRSKDRSTVIKAAGSLFRQAGTSYVLLRLNPPTQASRSVVDASRRARMLTALSALPDGFVVLSEDRNILSANAAFCEAVQVANESQLIGQPLERWLGRPGVDLQLIWAILREHGSLRNFSTVVRNEYGVTSEAMASAVLVHTSEEAFIGLVIRLAPPMIATVPANPVGVLPHSGEQLKELVGRVSLKEIVRQSADMIERLCIEAALQVSGDNRASAAQLLGLSRQGLYLKLRRHGLGDLESSEGEHGPSSSS